MLFLTYMHYMELFIYQKGELSGYKIKIHYLYRYDEILWKKLIPEMMYV